MRVLSKKSNPWEVIALVNKLKDGTAVVNSVSQRGIVWNTKDGSSMIDSILHGVYVGAITCNLKNGKYSILEGQQRSYMLKKYMEDGYRLVGVTKIDNDDGTSYELEGRLYSELPSELQNKIKKQSIAVHYYDNLNAEEEAYIIRKTNSGKKMTTVEWALIGAKSYHVYKELSHHEIFAHSLSETAMNRSTYAEIIVKTWITLYGEEMCFDKKVFEPTMTNVEITEAEEHEIKDIYDYIINVNNLLRERKENKKKNKRAARYMLKKIHLLSIVPIVSNAIKNEVPHDEFADWVAYFFSGEGRLASIDDNYNENAKNGTGHSSAIQARTDAIQKSWETFLG